MKILFIGGSGNISSAVSKLAIQRGIDLYHLRRGTIDSIEGVTNLTADINDLPAVKKLLQGHRWDTVINWIAYVPSDIQRDFELFSGFTDQYIFISSASAYQKPPVNPVITESTPLKNPYWEYSRNKIACEELLIKLYRENNFPVTIVRPSHTYHHVIPITLGGWKEYTTVDRMKKGLPIVVQGDGTSLWTLTHADDFSVGLLGLAGNRHAHGESFHITSDEALTWNQIYETVAEAAGTKANIIHIPSEFIINYAEKNGYPSERGSLLGDKMHCALFDNAKIKSFVPEFHTTILFSEGIRRTLKWFEAKPERMVVNGTTNKLLDELISKYQ
jgi:nucleoside-diphosphate-sugar epimerase